MQEIKIMINGIPGKVAVTIAEHLIDNNMADGIKFYLIPFSLTGKDIDEDEYIIGNTAISLVKPDKRDEMIKKIKKDFSNFISVDFTHPSAVNSNARFYVKNDLPFVMGTTGGDREKLKQTVYEGKIPAVIAPNMAKQIVGFQAMMEYAANEFPDLFKGYKLTIKESHQKGKADTSGTAKAMVKYFNHLGIPFSEKDIIKERDPEKQKNILKIPEQHLSGHGWHTYTLTSADDTVKFQFKHNINGRDIYVNGTIDGVIFLNNRLKKDNRAEANHSSQIHAGQDGKISISDGDIHKNEHEHKSKNEYENKNRYEYENKNGKGIVYSMIDVLKNTK